MLLLFDIDATLVTTSRSGILALLDAGREAFGPGFAVDTTDFAGRLDPLIIEDLLVNNNLPRTDAARLALRDGYRKYLGQRLAAPGVASALPGVLELLEALERDERVTLGLLTGNFPDTGEAKLRACGIDPERFHLAIWGDMSPHSPPCRTHLPPLALRRYVEQGRGEIRPESVVIIGDTPHDVRCALENGCWCLAVATGQFRAEQLEAAGAHRAVANLAATEDIAGWLIGRAAGTLGR